MSDNHKIVQAPEVAIVDSSQNQLHPLIVALSRGEIDTVTMEKVMDLQERYEKREAEKAYNAAMVALKGELPTFIEQDKEVNFEDRSGKLVNYTHATAANVVSGIVPHLTEYGFSHSWIPRNDASMVYVKCRLTHADGHSEKCEIGAPPDLSGKKSLSQGVSSTITRLERYTILALLGIVTKDMREIDPRESDNDTIDANRNLQAVAYLQSVEISLQEAEEYVQRDVRSWTAGDLAILKEWIKKERRVMGLKKEDGKTVATAENPAVTKEKQELGELQMEAIKLAKKLWSEDKAMNELSKLCRKASIGKFSIISSTKEQAQWAITELSDRLAAIEKEQ